MPFPKVVIPQLNENDPKTMRAAIEQLTQALNRLIELVNTGTIPPP